MNNFEHHFTTQAGTKFVRGPLALLVAQTRVELHPELGVELSAIDPAFEEGAADYERTIDGLEHPETLDGYPPSGVTHGSALVQLGGQLCYLSFDPEGRTPLAENAKYVDRILSSGHGSVLEHVNYTLLFFGIDRACTHELVRHRAGMAYSQVSQRYVGPKHLRFVMPWEDQQREDLGKIFEASIDRAASDYECRVDQLRSAMPQEPGESATDWRKRIQSSARSVLPNSTEAPTLVTGNARAWRHVFTMRCSKFADVRIRRPFVQALRVLQSAGGNLFADFEITPHKDGTEVAVAKYPKV